MYTKIKGLLLVAAATLFVTVSAIAQNSMFLRQSPIGWMDAADRAILRATIEAVLAAPDGTVTDWSNPDTGSRGRVKVLDTHEDLGTTCRTIMMRNETSTRTGGGQYRLCLADDDTWKFAPNAAE